jgi:hypothetical protein
VYLVLQTAFCCKDVPTSTASQPMTLRTAMAGQWKNSGSPGASSEQEYDEPNDSPERDLCLSQPLTLVLVPRFMNMTSAADRG